MKKLVNHLLVAITILPLVGSCGKSDSGGDEQRQEFDEGSLDGSTIDGTYQAKFITLNPHVNGTIPGSLTLFRDGDRLMTYVRLFAGKPKAWHQQGIYLGRRCPDLGDDRNGDTFVDIEEAMAVVGKMIIPLDANMNSQAAGGNFFPVADISGYYHYERVSSFNRMFDDLKTDDKDPSDHIAKLGADEKFGFTGRVFMVMGVSEDTVLPETVAGLGRRKAFQTLPITCGIIQRHDVTIGTPNTDIIPGPVAEVQEGQDQPAPYEDDDSSTGGTVAGTTGTNDSDDGEVGDGGASGETAGGTTSGERDEEPRGETTGRDSGGFIGGFIGGRDGGSGNGGTSGGTSTGGNSTGGTTTDEDTTSGGTTVQGGGGFIGGFIGGNSNGL